MNSRFEKRNTVFKRKKPLFRIPKGKFFEMSQPNDQEKRTTFEPNNEFQSGEQNISSRNFRPLSGDEHLYSPRQISILTEEYNYLDPYSSVPKVAFVNHNPSLLAHKNKAITIKPDISSPSKQRCKTSQATLRKSVLQRAPLGALKDPTEIYSLQVVSRKIEEERQTIAFPEDPVAYFSKKKEGGGHHFIYLIYKRNPKDLDFSPYDLEKVPHDFIGNDFFTMSTTSVTHSLPDGTTESLRLDVWAHDKSNFDALRKLKIFSTFYFWKPFRIWKNFVMKQRFNQLDKIVVRHPFFLNPKFFIQTLQFNQLQGSLYELLQNLLLTFHSQRKYKLEEFDETSKTNIEKLKSDYQQFIENISQNIYDLYMKISDPRLVQVQDSDFPEIKRRNPNLQQLITLEREKAIKRVENTDIVNHQIIEIGSYIRMIDYMLLETLVDGCIKCWKIAEKNVVPPESNVFQVEVLFNDDGKVAFKPTYDNLINSISSALDTSLITLNKLPRLCMQQLLHPLLRDSGMNLVLQAEDGPSFTQILSNTNVLDKIKENMLSVVINSYQESILYSHVFDDFYPIYKLGQTWDVRNYVTTRDGRRYEGPLAFDQSETTIPDDFLINWKDQPVVNFVEVGQDISRFRVDITRVDGLRSGAVRGAIYVDSRVLKTALTPIPQRSLMELQELLTNLSAMKSAQLLNVLKFYCQRLKLVPQSLDDYVAFSATLQRTIEVMPQMRDEIEFIDKMNKLFDDFDLIHNPNTVPVSYKIFTNDQNTAMATRDDFRGMFTDALRGSIRQLAQRISKYYTKATSIPTLIKDADVDTRLPKSIKLNQKIEELKTRVTTVVYQQEVMKVTINSFSSYKDLVEAGTFSVRIYESLGKWLTICKLMAEIPFSQINIKQFRYDIDKLYQDSLDLQASHIHSVKNYDILNELVTKIQDTLPFVEQLELLANGRMQTRHWNMLFEACDRQNGYHASITIEELMNLGILRAKDRIQQITTTSIGESELEQEFLKITNHWNKVQLPVADSPSKMTEETLLLGPTEPLIIEIQDTIVTLDKMLTLPYVIGIKESVILLTASLDNISQIIEAWRLFQSNWVILLALFQMDDAKTILPLQANRFSSVQRKWSAIAKFTLKDPRLFQVCSYPSLLQLLHENNVTMESILASLGKYIDAKRFIVPRFCFLSNKDVLTIATTKIYSELEIGLTKLFMHVSKFNCHEKENLETAEEVIQSTNVFNNHEFYGLYGNDGSELVFDNPIPLDIPMDKWIHKLIKEMKKSVKKKIINSIIALDRSKFVDWIDSDSLYILLIAFHCNYTSNIERCLLDLNNEPDGLSDYELTLINIIKQLKEKIQESPNHTLSCLVSQAIQFRDQTHYLCDYQNDPNLGLKWSQIMKIRYDFEQTGSIFVDHLNNQCEHGYEFWGDVPHLIYTPAVNDYLSNLSFYLSHKEIPMLTSTTSAGKQLLLSYYACLSGSFIYILRSFPDVSEIVLSRLFIGAISSGSWLAFTNIDMISKQSLCYLFDTLRLYISSYLSKMNRITIQTHSFDINPNCRFFLTSNVNFMKSENIPSQLKSFVRPISFSKPSDEFIINLKLMAYGYQQHQKLSRQLLNFLNSFLVVTSQINSTPSLISKAMLIIKKAKDMLNNETTEQFTLIFSCYDHYISLCDESKKNLLLRIMYSSFINELSEADFNEKINHYKQSNEKEFLLEQIKLELYHLALELPVAYLTEQIFNLITLMKTYSCIIIVGPPNSGKTTVLKVLKKLLDLESIRSKIPNSKPIDISSLYHFSYKWNHIFGHAYEDQSLGPVFSYGQLQSSYSYLLRNSNKNHILKFDGKLTEKVSTFVSQFVGSPHLHQITMNTLDTFSIQNGMYVVIETTNLNNATPLLLSKCGILQMNNLQIATPITPALPVCKLEFPVIPFARASVKCSDFVVSADIPLIKNIFCKIAPKIVSYIYHTPNIVCFSEYAKRLEGGTIILADVLPYYAASLGLYLIYHSDIKKSDELKIKAAFVIAFFKVYIGILEEKEINKFSEFCSKEFMVKIPENWVGYNVSDSFWNTFNAPSLLSLMFSNEGNLEPIDLDVLDDPFFYDDNEDNPQLPTCLDEIKVCHAQILPQLRLSQILLTIHQNIIIHGPCDSGKTSFLDILCQTNESIIPIYIQASDSLDSQTIVQCISSQTSLLSKATMSNIGNKSYVLIFDGIEPHHIHIMEFIRMILTNHTIPLISPNDEKVFEFATVHQCNVVVTTRDYKKLPIRFLVNFCPIQLHPITELSTHFIAKQLLMKYGMNDQLAESTVTMTSMMVTQYPQKFLLNDLLLTLSTLCFISDKTDNSLRLSCVLSSFIFTALHKYQKNVFMEKVLFVLNSECKNEQEIEQISRCLNYSTVIYPLYTYSSENKQLSVSMVEKDTSKVIEKLTDKLLYYNMNSIEKLVLRFTPRIVIQWTLLFRTLSQPGLSVILEGRTAMGKYSMTRLVANMCETDFVYIAEPTAEEILSREDRMNVILGILMDVVSTVIKSQKKFVIFIKATKNNEQEVRIVCNFIANGDFISVFNKDTIDELFTRLSLSHNFTNDQKIPLIKQVQWYLKRNIHAVVSKSGDCGYELNYNGFQTILFDNENIESIKEITEIALRNDDIEDILGSYASQVLHMLPLIPQIPQKLNCHVHPNQFFDFIDTCTHFFKSDYDDLVTKNDNIQSALNFISTLQTESQSIDKRLDQLIPTLQRMLADSDSLQNSYYARKESMAIRKAKFEKDLNIKKEKVQLIQNELNEIDDKRKELMPNLQQYQKSVSQLTRNEVETIRLTAIDPKPPLKLLIEVLCVFVDLPPSFEIGGNKLLMNPDFVQTILEKVTSTVINPELLSVLNPLFNNPELTPEKLDELGPSLSLIYYWIRSICDLTELNALYEEKKELFDSKTKDLNEYIEQLETELASIEQMEQSLETENRALIQSTSTRESLEKEFELINERKSKIDNLLKGIDQFADGWNNELNEFSSQQAKSIGNAIIFSFYSIYCGSMMLETRKQSLDTLLEILKNSGIETNYDKPIEEVHRRYIIANSSEHLGRIAQNALDAHHLVASLRTPLLIDPDGLIINCISNHKKFIVISQNCSTLELTVSNAVSEGKSLIITDVNELHPIVKSIISLEIIHVQPTMNLEIRIGSKLVTWNQHFKLYLTSSIVDINKLPDELLSRVSVVNTFSSSLSPICDSITNTFLEFFNPEALHKYQDLKKKELEIKIERFNYKHDILALLADIVKTQSSNPRYDYLNDQETIDELMHMKDMLTSMPANPPEFATILDQYNQTLSIFKQHIYVCSDFWRAMSRDIPYINSSLNFSFSNYLRNITTVFSNDGLHPGPITSDQNVSLMNSLIAMTFNFVSSSMKYNEMIFFLFMSSYYIRARSNRGFYMSETELYKIFLHVYEEISHSKCEYGDVVASSGETFNHLKYTNLINIYQYVSRFIVEQFGPDYSSFFSHFQVDSIISNSATQPTFIITSEKVDPTGSILQYITQRCRFDNIEAISLSDNLELIHNAKKIIVTAQSRGTWILLFNSIPSRAAASVICDAYTQMISSSVNTNFRLVVVTNSLEYLSLSMLAKSRRIVVDAFPSLRNTLLQLIHQNASNIKSHLNLKALKKITYTTSVLISLIKSRSLFKPFGFTHSSNPNDVSLSDSMEILKSIIDQTPSEISIDIYRQELNKYIFSYVPIQRDNQIIQCHTKMIIADNILNDDYTIHNPDPEQYNFDIPADGPVSDYAQAAQLMPVFPSPEVFDIPTNSYKNWIFSQWIAQPFINYLIHSPSCSLPKSSKEERIELSEIIGTRKKLKFDFQYAVNHVNNLRISIPERIGTGEHSHFVTIFGSFLLSEVETLNSIIIFFKYNLKLIKEEFDKKIVSKNGLMIVRNQIPADWRRVSNFWINGDLDKLVSFVTSSHKQLLDILKNRDLNTFDMSLILKPKLLLQSFLLQYANSKNLPIDRFKYEFLIMEQTELFQLSEVTKKENSDTIILKGISIGLGCFHNGQLELNQDMNSSPFRFIHKIKAKVVQIQKQDEDIEKVYKVPLFQQALNEIIDIDNDFDDVVNGESNNFVWYIETPTNEDPIKLEKSGIAFFCRVPQQLL